MVRTNQGGSILSFAVLGGIMALLLIGGAYIVRRNLTPAERSPQVATSERQDGSPEQSQRDDKPAPADNKDQSEEPAAPRQNTAPENANESTTRDESTETPRPAPAPATCDHASSGLPTAGPSSALFGGLMMSGLIGAVVAYIQSRRLRASL